MHNASLPVIGAEDVRRVSEVLGYLGEVFDNFKVTTEKAKAWAVELHFYTDAQLFDAARRVSRSCEWCSLSRMMQAVEGYSIEVWRPTGRDGRSERHWVRVRLGEEDRARCLEGVPLNKTTEAKTLEKEIAAHVRRDPKSDGQGVRRLSPRISEGE